MSKQRRGFLRKFLKIVFWACLFFIFALFAYFFTGEARPAEEINWGVNFSQKHAEKLGLSWKETYLALIDDLGAKRLKIAVPWDLIEPQKGKYRLDDLDWQIHRAKERSANILLVIGMKTPRWPECHIPEWASALDKESQQERILLMLREVVSRYKDEDVIWAWQVENEPFFSFGDCPWADKPFLEKEVALVRSLDDNSRPIVVSESGELSFWISGAKLGDIVGPSLYRKIWLHDLGMYFDYPFPPVFYNRKAKIIEKVFGKKVIGGELQAEPWGPALLYDSSLSEQERTMNLEKFKENIEFARKTGLDTFYLWGAEWWYWLKEKQEMPEIWNEAKILFRQ